VSVITDLAADECKDEDDNTSLSVKCTGWWWIWRTM